MRRLAALVAPGLLAASVLGESATPSPPPAGSPAQVRVPPRPADWDLEEIRNIFRFADEASGSARAAVGDPGRAIERTAPPEAAPSPPPGPRVVGLIRGAAGLRVALAAEGEVVVLGPGDSALGLTLLDVDEEGALVRGPDGVERRLPLEGTTPAH